MTASLAFGLVAVLWTIGLIAAPAGSPVRLRINTILPLATFGVFIIVFAVSANSGVMDRFVYTTELQAISEKGIVGAFETSLDVVREPLYVLFLWLVSTGGESTVWLYFWVGVACTAAYLFSIVKLFSWWQAPLILLTTLSVGIITGYASLVIRQGLSMAILFSAVCLVLAGRRVRWWCALLIGAALLHWSAIPAAVVIFVLARTTVRLRWALVAWVVASVLFLTGLQSQILQPIAKFIPQVASYTNGSLVYAYAGGVNRLDFFVYSFAVLSVGLLALRFGVTPSWYSKLVVIYVFLNIYFLLFGFISYSDRLAAYSWSLAPLIFATPFAAPSSVAARFVTAMFVGAVLVLGVFRGSFLSIVGLEPF